MNEKMWLFDLLTHEEVGRLSIEGYEVESVEFLGDFAEIELADDTRVSLRNQVVTLGYYGAIEGIKDADGVDLTCNALAAPRTLESGDIQDILIDAGDDEDGPN